MPKSGGYVGASETEAKGTGFLSGRLMQHILVMTLRVKTDGLG